MMETIILPAGMKFYEKKEAPDNWLTDEMWAYMDKEVADFVFEQGEKYMQQLEDTAKAITKRCYMVLGALLAVCLFLAIFSFTVDNERLDAVCFLFIVFSVWLSLNIIEIVKSKIGASIGRPPKDFLRLCDLERREEWDESVKLYELENLQHKIETLEADNEIRAKEQTRVLYLAIIAFAIVFEVISLVN